jgi:hypothetical protein
MHGLRALIAGKNGELRGEGRVLHEAWNYANACIIFWFSPP